MNRKDFFKLLGAGVGTALFTGCSDMLEPKVYQNLTPNNFFSSSADFNNAVIAIYSVFSTDWGVVDQGVNTWYANLFNADIKTYLMRSEGVTDEMHARWGTALTNFTFGPATFDSTPSVYSKIRYVAKATDVIHNIKESTANVPEDLKMRYVAEAKCLRGWLMYILYNYFGPVGVKLDPKSLYDTTIIPRPSKSDYISWIEKDLTEAIPDLDDKYNNDFDNWGRVTKGTARMILLRLYMHEKQWSKAESMAKELMGMGFSLLPNYENVFNQERNTELIYAVPANASSPNYYVTEVLPADFDHAGSVHRAAGAQAWGGFWMPWEF